MDIKRTGSVGRMSSIVEFNGLLYLSGQTAADRAQGIRGQTEQVLSKVDMLLAEAGSDKSRVLMTQIWLKDIWDFAEMNDVWDAWTAPGASPARATAQCEMASPDILIELIVTAAK